MSFRRLARACALVLVVATFLGAPALARPQSVNEMEEVEAPAEIPYDEYGRSTPRGTATGFLEAANKGDFERAAFYLNVEDQKSEEAQQLARQLFRVLDRTLWVDLDAMSDQPEGATEDGRFDVDSLVGETIGEGARASFQLEYVALGERAVWLFSRSTLARVGSLYETYGFSPIEKLLPMFLVDRELLEIRLWQWIALLLLVVAAYFAAWIAAAILVQLMRPLVSRSKTDFDDRLLSQTIPPLRLMATVGLFQAGMPFLTLKLPAEKFFDGACTLLAVFGVTWLIYRGIDLFAGSVRDTMEKRGQGSATYLVPLGARTLKVTIGVLTLLAALDNLGFDVTTIIAGLGVGGLAVALALRPTLENIFGGVTVLVDQPVKPGEFCRYGDKLGTVEDVGIRSTRIRSLDRTVVTVSNSEFSSMQIENFARRDRVRLITTLGLRYETSADQLRHVLIELRRLIHSHPALYEEPRRVRFVGFGASSLDLEVLCYVDTDDYAEYLAVREDIYLRTIDIVGESGSGFAFPSTTMYKAEDDGLDEEKARAAEAQVAAWRAENALMFPEFSEEDQAAMRDSIAYPPKGSRGSKGAAEAGAS